MKIINYTILLISAATLMYCKSSKETIAIKPVEAYAPSVLQLEKANKRWANTTADEIMQGQNIYTTKCIECHKNHPVEAFTEKKWLKEIDDMAPNAKLTSEEKTNLTKYLLSMRDTKVSTVPK